MKVFWDTNLFIYLIERHPTFHARVVDLYRQQRERGDRLTTSALTLGELMAQPLRLGREDLVDAYTTLLTSEREIGLVDFDATAARYYARVRAQTSLRQPDAIQMACALSAGATLFVTNDERLWGVSVPGIEAVRGL